MYVGNNNGFDEYFLAFSPIFIATLVYLQMNIVKNTRRLCASGATTIAWSGQLSQFRSVTFLANERLKGARTTGRKRHCSNVS